MENGLSGASTSVGWAAEMLPAIGSDCLPLTWTELITVVPAAVFAVTRMLIAADCPFGRLPRFAVTVTPDCKTEPFLVADEMNDTPPGSVSIAIMPVASEGPRLVTVTVYVRFSPSATASAESVFTTERSVCAITTVGWIAVLLPDTGSLQRIGSSAGQKTLSGAMDGSRKNSPGRDFRRWPHA